MDSPENTTPGAGQNQMCPPNIRSYLISVIVTAVFTCVAAISTCYLAWCSKETLQETRAVSKDTQEVAEKQKIFFVSFQDFLTEYKNINQGFAGNLAKVESSFQSFNEYLLKGDASTIGIWLELKSKITSESLPAPPAQRMRIHRIKEEQFGISDNLPINQCELSVQGKETADFKKLARLIDQQNSPIRNVRIWVYSMKQNRKHPIDWKDFKEGEDLSSILLKIFDNSTDIRQITFLLDFDI